MRSVEGARLELDIIEEPKPGGGVRAITVLRPQDDACYRDLVRRVAPRIDAGLRHGVAANRLGSWERSRGWIAERGRWRLQVAGALASEARPVAVLSDVRSCYSSVGPRALERGLARAGVTREDSVAILAFLSRCRRAGVDGLPTGPAASAVLANAVLAVADGALSDEGVRFVRWVDDVVIVAPSPAGAEHAWRVWARALREVGLRPHEAKTRMIADREEALQALLLGEASLMPTMAVA